MSPLLSRAERRLYDELKELLPPEEELQVVIVVWPQSKPRKDVRNTEFPKDRRCNAEPG